MGLKKLVDSSESALSIKSNIMWNTVGNFAYLFSQWLLTYVVVRLLGYEDAGVLSLATSICGSLVSVSLYGMRNFQVSDIRNQYSDETYVVSRFATSVFSLVICFVFVCANGYTEYVGACVLLYMGFKVSESVSDVYQGILQKKMRMDYIGKSFLIKGIVTLVVFCGAVVISKSLLVSIIAMTVASVLIVFFYDRKKANLFFSGSRHLNPSALKSLLVECVPLAVFTLLFNTLTLAPRYYLEMELGAELLGIYASIAMPVVIVQVSASYIFAPLTTPFAEYLNRGDTKGFASLAKKIVLIIILLSIVSLVGFSFAGDWGLILLFGDSMVPYTYLLLPLVVCTILVAFSWFLSTLLTVMRRLKLLLAVCSITFAVVMLGGLPFIRLFGMNGASFILIAGLTIYAVLSTIFIWVGIRKAAQL